MEEGKVEEPKNVEEDDEDEEEEEEISDAEKNKNLMLSCPLFFV